jgi:hypothetical protein
MKHIYRIYRIPMAGESAQAGQDLARAELAALPYLLRQWCPEASVRTTPSAGGGVRAVFSTAWTAARLLRHIEHCLVGHNQRFAMAQLRCEYLPPHPYHAPRARVRDGRRRTDF